MEEKRRFVCITCPVGCSIDAIIRDGELAEASGNLCKQGLAFVREELTAPKRTLTTTVRVTNGALPLVPVRSSEALPKGRLLEIAAKLREITLHAPVQEHQVVWENVFDTGVNIITSRALDYA